MTTLEHRYRRLLALYPRRHRDMYADEMLGVLMSDTPSGRDRPTLGAVLDLVRGALAARMRAARTGGVLDLPSWRAAVGLFVPAAAVAMVANDIDLGLASLVGPATGGTLVVAVLAAGWLALLCTWLVRARPASIAIAGLLAVAEIWYLWDLIGDGIGFRYTTLLATGLALVGTCVGSWPAWRRVGRLGPGLIVVAVMLVTLLMSGRFVAGEPVSGVPFLADLSYPANVAPLWLMAVTAVLVVAGLAALARRIALPVPMRLAALAVPVLAARWAVVPLWVWSGPPDVAGGYPIPVPTLAVILALPVLGFVLAVLAIVAVERLAPVRSGRLARREGRA